jgi:hypothetical protein
MHTQSLHSQMCVYIQYSAQHREAGQAKEIKSMEQQWMLHAKEVFPCVFLGTCAIGSSAPFYIFKRFSHVYFRLNNLSTCDTRTYTHMQMHTIWRPGILGMLWHQDIDDDSSMHGIYTHTHTHTHHACCCFCPFPIQCVPVFSVHVCVWAFTKCLSDSFKETSDKLKVEFKMGCEWY